MDNKELVNSRPVPQWFRTWIEWKLLRRARQFGRAPELSKDSGGAFLTCVAWQAYNKGRLSEFQRQKKRKKGVGRDTG